MITKKRDWKPGKFAFGFKIYTPAGGCIELDCPNVNEQLGRKLLAQIMGTTKEMNQVTETR